MNIMPFKLLPVLAFSWVSLTAPATAGTAEALTAENLREACDNLVLAVRGIQAISQEDPGAMLCLGFIAGWSQAMEGVRDKPFCLPVAGTAQPGDVADLIVTYVDDHPETRPLSAHQAMLETLIDAFPCTPETTEEPTAEEQPPLQQ